MHVEELTAAAAPEWDAYVEAHPSATCYHLRAWREVAEEAYGMAAPFLLCRDGAAGPVRGVLPLFVVRRWPLRPYVVTGLFGAYGVVLADSAEAGRALLKEARRVTDKSGATHLLHKSLGDDACTDELTRVETSVMATLPLREPDALWRGFRDKTRNAIRKAQKAHLEARFAPEDLPAYYDVLAENMHRKGTPIYGLRFMEVLARALGPRCEIVTLRHEGQVVSAALLVFHKDVVYAPFASSRASAFPMNPNNLLYWEIMQRGWARGARLLDFGRSPKDSSTLAFKLGWGAQTTLVPFYLHVQRGEPPLMEASTPAAHRAIELWQRLPRGVADALGPSICRRFLV